MKRQKIQKLRNSFTSCQVRIRRLMSHLEHELDNLHRELIDLDGNSACTATRTAKLNKVVSAVCESFGLAESVIFSRRGMRSHSDARLAAYYISDKTLPNASWKELGEFYGKDHTAIIAGVRRCAELLSMDADYRTKVDRAIAFLNGGEIKIAA